MDAMKLCSVNALRSVIVLHVCLFLKLLTSLSALTGCHLSYGYFRVGAESDIAVKAKNSIYKNQLLEVYLCPLL